MNVVLLGPSGVGKGTHAGTLAAHYHVRHLASGDLFRHNVRARTALGLLARRYMNQGELVPDEVVEAMIEEWADRLPEAYGTLFDGFPRTADQVRFLDELLARLNRKLDAAVYLKVADAEIVERVVGRRICPACAASYHARSHPPRVAGRCDACNFELYQRPDDTEELARARLRVFHRVTEPVLEHYARAGQLLIVDGTGTIAAVSARLFEALDAIAAGRARFVTVNELAAQVGPARPPPVSVARDVAVRPDLVLLGGPGSGKGTQAERLSAALGLPHIATGDLFRKNLQQGTPLGVLAKTYMDRGDLVPDEVTEGMVEHRLVEPDAQGGFILDGFPRTLPQAQALSEMLARLQRHLAGVVYIQVPDAAIIERLTGRLICRDCQSPYHVRFNPPHAAGQCDRCAGRLYQREDDNPDTVRARLATFHRQTEPVIAYYRGLELLHAIPGEGDVAGITRQTLQTIRHLTARHEASAGVEA